MELIRQLILDIIIIYFCLLNIKNIDKIFLYFLLDNIKFLLFH